MGPILGGLPRLKLVPANVNIVCVGNSLTAGDGGGVNGDYPYQLAGLSGTNGVTVVNSGVSGATTEDLITQQATKVDPYWITGKTNVLVIWEGTNSMVNPIYFDTPSQAVSALATYIANVQAVHHWIVVVMTCLPRESNNSQTETDALNARLDSYNALLRTNYRSIGAKGLVDVRTSGSVFNPPSYTIASFSTWAQGSGLWYSVGDGYHVHLAQSGYLAVANMVLPAIQKLPAR